MNNCIEIVGGYPVNTVHEEDIFIATGSPESRCLGLMNKMGDTYHVSKAIIIEYDHECPEREGNIIQMKEALERHSDALQVIKANEAAIIPKIAEIIEIISQSIEGVENPKITIDISTMIKWHLLILLKALAQKSFLSYVNFVYTEPHDYILDSMYPLSFGNKGTFPVPFYQGNYDFYRETCLILMLGYEGQRSMAIFESIDPEKCLLIIPKPPYKPEWEGRTEEMNKEIINVVGQKNIYFADARNPNKVKNQLHEIVSKSNISNYNHIFAPLGPKPQLLGLFDFYMENSDKINIVYVSPLRHNPLYSTKIGRSWIIKERDE